MKIERIAVFGASTTYGYVDESGRGGWVGRLREWFEPLDPNDHAVFNLGISGDRSTDILDRLPVEASHRSPDLIILSISVNDSSRRPKPTSSTYVSLKQYQKNFSKIITLSKRYARHVVAVSSLLVDEKLTIPVSWGPYYYYASDRAQFDEVGAAICRRRRVPFLDLAAEWRSHGDEFKKWLYDGLHPNAEGHERIFRSVKKFLVDQKLISEN